MIIVGIDPGVNTGLAVWDTSIRQFLDIRCSGIVDAMDYLRRLREERTIGLIVFEDARKRKWIPREKDLAEFRGRAMGAGSVKRTPLSGKNGASQIASTSWRHLRGKE